jgi:16S rRNA U516 pseudouridylate synthase RsuA-like enzyme
VSKLRRVRFGPIALGALPPGHLRPLAGGEIAALRRAGARGGAERCRSRPA